MSKEPSPESLQLAAQAWCTEETSDIEMDVRLAKAFAKILDRELAGLEILLCAKHARKLPDNFECAICAYEARNELICMIDTRKLRERIANLQRALEWSLAFIEQPEFFANEGDLLFWNERLSSLRKMGERDASGVPLRDMWAGGVGPAKRR